MRLWKLLVSLCVTAMAFALFGANARAATIQSGGRQDYSVTVSGSLILSDLPPGTTDLAALCTTMNTNCGRVSFTSGATGTATITGTFDASNQAELVLCDMTSGDSTPLDACSGGNQVACTTTEVVNTNNTVTITLVCPVIAGHNYDLVIVPVMCSDITDPFCSFVVSGSIVINGTGGTTQGTGASTGWTNGGGKVNLGMTGFSLEARTDKSNGHVLVQIPGSAKCKSVRALAINVITLGKNGPGTATVTGTAYVNGNQSDTFPFEADVGDFSNPGRNGDTFHFASTDGSHPECESGDPSLTAGNVNVHASTAA